MNKQMNLKFLNRKFKFNRPQMGPLVFIENYESLKPKHIFPKTDCNSNNSMKIPQPHFVKGVIKIQNDDIYKPV